MLHFKGLFDRQGDEIVGIASTDTPDRDGDVILQEGWETQNFMKNPVILAGHDWFSFPIGKATDLAIQNGQMIFKMVFSATERGQEALQLVKEGVLNAFSVGFMAKEWQDPAPGMNAEMVISKAELLEISLVSVPANPEAIVLAKGMKDNELAQHIAERALKNKRTAKAVEKLMTQEVEVKEGDKIECECGMTYTLKFTTQPEAAPSVEEETPGKEGEDGEGREDGLETDQKALVKGALKHLQRVLEIENRKEDRI